MVFLLTWFLMNLELSLHNNFLVKKCKSGIQRDFNILFMPVFFMSLCILVIRPLITSLAEKRQVGEMVQFYSIIKKIFVFLILVGFLTTLVSYLIGTPVLSLYFRSWFESLPSRINYSSIFRDFVFNCFSIWKYLDYL